MVYFPKPTPPYFRLPAGKCRINAQYFRQFADLLCFNDKARKKAAFGIAPDKSARFGATAQILLLLSWVVVNYTHKTKETHA